MKDTDWEILYTLYRTPNLTKAASLLYLTQPSLTKRLQRMEAEFQVSIVDRTQKGLCFTPEGEYLARRAELHLTFLRETRAELDKMRAQGGRVITLGASYTYSKYALTDVLTQYADVHPGVRFNVVNEQSDLLFRKLLEGSVDAAFLRGDYEGPVERVLIGQNQAFLVTKEPVPFEALPGLQRICYRTNDQTRELLEGWWRDRLGAEPPAGMEAGYVDVAWQMVGRGLGYTCCFLPDQFENQYGLHLAPLEYGDGSPVVRNTWLLYPGGGGLPKHLADFIRYAIQELSIERG